MVARSDALRALLLVAPALAALLAYLPSTRFELVWDDPVVLRDAAAYRVPGGWSEALSRPFSASPNYFRPLTLASYALETAPGADRAARLHRTNLLLHALNTLLVTLLARRLWGSAHAGAQAAGLLAGLLYGLHPALVEGVAFVSGRFDLLATAFLLLGLWIELAVRTGWLRAVGFGVCFLLAALCKEMALGLALALPCWVAARQCAHSRDRREPAPGLGALSRSLAPLVIAVALAGGAYLVLRHAALGHLLVPETRIAAGSALQHALLVTRTLAGYLLLVVWPFGTLSPIHHAALPVASADPRAWISVATLAATAVGLVLWVRGAPRSGWLAVAGVLALLPVSNALPLRLGGGAYLAERFLVFPVSFFALATASAVVEHGERLRHDARALPRWIVAFALLWLLACGIGLERTLRHWRNDTQLWRWASERAPASAIPHANLAVQLLARGAYDEALASSRRALMVDPASADAHHDAGVALLHLRRPAEAQAALTRAIELAPDNALFLNSLASALRLQGELDAARALLRDQVLARAPALESAHLNLGLVYLEQGRPDLARAALRDAERLVARGPEPDLAPVRHHQARTQEPERWLRLASYHLEQGAPSDALRALEEAARLGAPPLDVLEGRATAAVRLQNWELAEATLRDALVLAPGDAGLHNNLGVVARTRGDRDAARAHFARAASLDPHWELPRQNLRALDQP